MYNFIIIYVDVTISYDKVAHIGRAYWILIGCPGSIFVSKALKAKNKKQCYHTKLFGSLNEKFYPQ